MLIYLILHGKPLLWLFVMYVYIIYMLSIISASYTEKWDTTLSLIKLDLIYWRERDNMILFEIIDVELWTVNDFPYFEAQGRIQLLVHDSSISSIHIYHRILRFKNYVVAMVNQVRICMLNYVVIYKLNQTISRIMKLIIETDIFNTAFNSWWISVLME